LDKLGSTNKKRIISISCVLCICVVFCIGLAFWIFKQQASKAMSNPVDLKTHRKISWEELRRATEDFSPGNLLGVGSYGSVYRGTLAGGETVAVKVFAVLDGERAEKSFDRECRTLGKVRHRNLLKIITACSTADLKALVLEFMPNGNLDGHLHGAESEKLSLEMRLRILLDVAHGLSYLHHDSCPPIVHCDLKPQNVLLDEDMTAHLADFGLAQMFTHGASTSTSTLNGSIGYIAPEYGRKYKITTKGDVYSYGILTLEVITEKKPTDKMFEGELTLPSWVSMASHDSRIEMLKGIVNTNGESSGCYSIVLTLLRVGLWCTVEAPENRPNMREVEDILTKILRTNYDRNLPTPAFQSNSSESETSSSHLSFIM
jgi:LRR receptor-like serine/threonine-protein kinase FLS2